MAIKATLVLSNTQLSMCSIFLMCVFCVAGDGGNDVSMIQAADCGIGIEGKVKVAITAPQT